MQQYVFRQMVQPLRDLSLDNNSRTNSASCRHFTQERLRGCVFVCLYITIGYPAFNVIHPSSSFLLIVAESKRQFKKCKCINKYIQRRLLGMPKLRQKSMYRNMFLKEFQTPV